MLLGIDESKYSRIDQIKLVEDSLEKVWRGIKVDHIPFKFFKGCFPQILFGPFSNTLSQMQLINLLVPNVAFLYALQTFENLTEV